MSEGTSKRRDWVKNAAIIFLTVMLLLTFFSNTIMNYSLPEVATVYVQPGSITAKIRGTGKVEATDPYNVVAKESRVITSVAVKQGDEVEKDDVLYYLEDAESAELVKAESELRALELEYMLAIFNGEVNNAMISQVESGDTDTFSSYQSKVGGIQNSVKAAENNVLAQQTNVNNLTKQLELTKNNSTADTTAEQAAVNSAELGVTNATSAVTGVDTKLANLKLKKAEVAEKISALEKQGIESQEAVNEKAAQAQVALDSASNYLSTTINGILTTYGAITNNLDAAQALAEAQSKAILDTITIDNTFTYEKKLESITAYDQVLAAYNTAKTTYDTAVLNQGNWSQNNQTYKNYLSQLASLENEIASAQEEQRTAAGNVANANSTLTTAKQVLADKKENKSNIHSQKELNDKLIEANNALATAKLQLEAIQKEQTNLVKNLQAELNLDNKNELIALKEKEIEKLKEKSMGAAVKSPVAGKITTLAHVAGETTKVDETIAVIQVAGKGFTAGFSVTNEQAKKVQVGDTAELQNSWYYQDMKIILTSIKPDPDNPGQKKLLTFTVNSSEVQAGQSLNISVGQRSANYELVVPNSAIREDNNGKFILIVEPKNSPLGNRYFATRVDVEVVASDDNNTAISAGIYGYEYVITTATKPVTAGKQVRLSD